MALVVKDRVRVNSVTAGTGTITLGSAILGFQDFSVIGDGNTTYYTIADPATGDWEVGIGTYTASGTTLSRDTILESSNAGSAVNFAANPKDVFVTYPAERAVYGDSSGTVNGYTITGGSINNTPIGASTPSTVVATQVDITAQGDLRLQDTTGGEYVALQAPGTLASSYTLTLPVDDGTAGQALITDGSGALSWSSAASGDVYGPASATDNAVARYDTTTGKLLQNSLVIIDDTGSVTGVNALTAESLVVNNNATLGSSNTDTLDVNARITTDLEPNTNNAKDIGTSGRNWRDGFFGRNLNTVNLAYTGTLTGGTGVIAIGTNQIYKDSSGNVGIGTATPATELDVVGPAGVTSFTGTTKLGVVVRGSTAATDYSGIDFIGNSQTNPTARIGVITTGSGSSMTFGTSNAYGSGITTAGMTINDDGIVGVGTTSPIDSVGYGAAVDIQGSLGGAVYLRDRDNTSLYTYLSFTGSNSTTYIWNVATGAMLFGTNDAERMRIASGGAVSIGKTVDTVTGAGIVLDPSGLMRITRAGTSSATHIQFANNGGTQVGSISTSGSTTTYSTSSDYRLKENVAPMTGALAKVQALKPVSYKWKAGGSAGQGFIAHELQEVFPEAVTGKKDAVDVNGKPEYQGVDTSTLVATLVSAIQEQQALITKLQADVAALQGR